MTQSTLTDEQRYWRRRILVSTWLAYAGLYFCRKPFYIAKATLARDLSLDVADLSHIGTAYLVCYTIGQFLNAGLGQARGARLVLLTGIMTSIVCNVAFGFANNYWTLFVFMCLNGFAQASGWPSVVGTLGRWTRRAERGTLMGFWGTCYQIGGIMANMWAAFWLARYGTQGAFFAASLVLLGVWFAVFAWQRNKPEDVGLPAIEEPLGEEEEKTASGSPWTRTLIINIALIGVFYFGIKFIRYALWSWTPYFLENNYNLAADDAGYMSTLFDVAGFLGVVVAGIVSDKLFNGRRAAPSFFMVIGMLIGCAALFQFGGVSLTWFAICLFVIGFMLYGPDSLLSGAGAIDIGTAATAVAAAGIINGMGSLGSVVQELVVANIYKGSEGQVGPVFAVLVAASMLSIVALSVVLIRERLGKAHL